jgi:hypothetical protein
MTASSHKPVPKALSPAQLHELRQILTGYDQHDLDRLNKLIQDPETFSDEIRQLLPLSIRKMVQKGDVTLDDIQPLLEEALKNSVQSNPKTLADILFPIMMPAIRKAVSEDIKQMLDKVNSTLENSFSPKRFGWRLKSIFSGKSYAEIVLSHAYIYQVKQVFLIHKNTGLLLAKVPDDPDASMADADLVSSMLSAIKDFVQDSFQQKDTELDAINMGDFNIWIEQGPHAIIAAIVAGNAPASLRDKMKESIEGIHINSAYELEHFEGDTTPFQINKSQLQNCVQQEEKPHKKSKPVALIVLGLILLGALGYWGYHYWQGHSRFNKFLNACQNTDGVFISDAGRSGSVFYIKGMADPLSVLPSPDSFDIQEKDVELQLMPFISLNRDIVLKRAKRLLKPPANVQFDYSGDTLYVKGTADKEWLAKVKAISYIPGINHLVLPDKVFVRKKPEMRKILAIESQAYSFGYGVDQLDSTQQVSFKKLILNTKEVLNFNTDADSVPVIVVRSYTSKKGNLPANERVAHARAMRFIHWMQDAGIPMEMLVPKVKFIEDPDSGNYPVRTVSFKVKYVKRDSL